MSEPLDKKSCRRASELISLSMDRPLTRRERLALRLHLAICRPCRVFRRQLRQLRTLLRDPGMTELPAGVLDAGLSPEARARIEQAMGRAEG